MAIKFRDDDDLKFLKNASEDDLKTLARYMTHDKDNSARVASELLEEDRFKHYAGDSQQYKKCWDLIAGELQLFGADSVVSLFRGTGVLYKEVLCDVCDQLKVKVEKSNSAYDIENKMLEKLAADAWDTMGEEEKTIFLKEIGLKVLPSVGLAAVQAAIKIGGSASYKMALIIANSVARSLLGAGLTFAANQTVVRTLSMFAGPIGWALNAALTIPAISGPAYRVTIPAVIQIAYMRRAAHENFTAEQFNNL